MLKIVTKSFQAFHSFGRFSLL